MPAFRSDRRPPRVTAWACAVLLLAMVGCRGETRTASGLDGWLAGTPGEKFDVVAKHLRGFDVAMVETGYRYQQLYWAGEDQNWPYADYQLQKIRLAIEHGLERRPKRAASAETFLTMVLPALGQAIAAHDQALFRQRFGAMTAACNTCHVAEQMASSRSFRQPCEAARRSSRRMWFEALVFATAVVAAGVAAITGFGIGSLLTPTLGLAVGTKVAVAAVSVPHLVGTAMRFWMLRDAVDGRVLWRFGLASAAGGLTGAWLHGWLSSPWLTIVFGVLLMFVAASELTGMVRRLRFHGLVAWIAGALSGVLGGLVGNQGGIRSAALLGFDLSKRTFVGTATAVGLIVDAARMPVYLTTVGRDVTAIWPLVALATLGVALGTLFGRHVLTRIPERRFRPLVALILAALGVAMLVQGLRS